MPVTRGHRVNVYAESPEMELPAIRNRDIIDITCGVLLAKLHKERFICPGINRECIEFQGQFITPKSFYVLAEKGSLKDWKNAIRINGKKIRRYIDSGELDFYNHAELCTGRCKSRMGHKTSLLPTDHLLSPSASLLNVSPTMVLGKTFSRANETAESLNSSTDSLSLMTDSFGEPKDVKPSPEQLSHMMLLNLKPGDKIRNQESSESTEHAIHPVHLAQINEGLRQGDSEDLMFWRAIVQLGLIDEFFREVKAKLDVLKVSMIKDYVPIEDARKASRIVNELGLKAKLDLKLCAHKYEFDRQRQKLEKEMEQLKKKVTEYEQKKEILKQKSDCYEALMTKKLKIEDGSSSPSQYTLETASGHVLLVNGENSLNTDEKKKTLYQSILTKSKSKPADDDMNFTLETSSGKVIMTSHGAQTKVASPVPFSSQDYTVTLAEDSPEPDSSEISSQASSSSQPVTSTRRKSKHARKAVNPSSTRAVRESEEMLTPSHSPSPVPSHPQEYTEMTTEGSPDAEYSEMSSSQASSSTTN